ncbi:hypothetical protein ES288_D06G065200v1, partial [Gossypium darwinii]
MEAPLSSRRVTRSQTLAASNNGIPVSKVKTKGSEKSASKARIRNGKQQQQERSALIDITNDSPIVGVAMKTPSSAVVGKGKTNMMTMMTPGFGEALRGQVKTLLQKVEEEAEVSKVLDLSEEEGLGSMLMDLPVVEEELNISEMVSANIEGQKCAITRSLLLEKVLTVTFSLIH